MKTVHHVRMWINPKKFQEAVKYWFSKKINVGYDTQIKGVFLVNDFTDINSMVQHVHNICYLKGYKDDSFVEYVMRNCITFCVYYTEL